MEAFNRPGGAVTSIFVSYRRADSQGWAGRLGEALSNGFGDVALFFDIGSIPPGENFVDAIDRALSTCEIMLALIGPGWLDARDRDGRRRLDDPGDFVCLEITSALRKGVRVVPVLLGGAAMPDAGRLPDAISALALRQAYELSDTRWDYDCERLVEAIERLTSLRRVAGSSTGGGQGVHISVGEGLTIENSTVGDIVGVKGGELPAPKGKATTEVAKGASLRGATVGDIAGVKGPSEPPSRK